MWWLVVLALTSDPSGRIPVYSVHYANKSKCKVASHWLAIRRPQVRTACIFFMPSNTPAPLIKAQG
jgi:hypothetical protein